MVGPHPDIRLDADIRWRFQRNCTYASAPAPASGYPSAAAGIRAGILGYPPSKGPATDRLEGSPSSRQGTCTSPAGRASFQPAICPSGRGYPLGYTDTRQQFAEKGPSAPKSAPAGGYPLAQAGIRQRITGIRQRITGIHDGYPSTISIIHLNMYCLIQWWASSANRSVSVSAGLLSDLALIGFTGSHYNC
ncbi:hypothetical protein PGTUg99_035765 [Puccinia graminis f. sp. tritici]|uniref:Uncharacterized protein n=1 Tax=Puccinia graminis f. sp. tritici TaxID=56615 RepID=A0A5B0R9E5_PUCGR|nr:hypothetical protein PGTUg99_035765 [Puccinia graminis f. sp. tritici]